MIQPPKTRINVLSKTGCNVKNMSYSVIMIRDISILYASMAMKKKNMSKEKCRKKKIKRSTVSFDKNNGMLVFRAR